MPGHVETYATPEKPPTRMGLIEKAEPIALLVQSPPDWAKPIAIQHPASGFGRPEHRYCANLNGLLGVGINEVIVPLLVKGITFPWRSCPHIGFHRHRNHHFGLLYPGNSPEFRRRRQCHPVECGLLYNSDGYHQGSDQPLTTGAHRAKNHGKAIAILFSSIGVAMIWIVIA